MTVDGWPLQTEYDGDGEDDDESTPGSALSHSSSDTFMVGFVIANIVGLQYYSSP